LLHRLLLLALLPSAAWAQSSGAPSYSAAGLVNAATGLPGPLAPNSLATLYGSNLAWVTASAKISDDRLPVKIANAGAQIIFGGSSLAHLLFVSPTQINFLVPSSRAAGTTTLVVVRDGFAGPTIPVTIAAVSPGLFQNTGMAAASHAGGSIITPDASAHAGEIVVLYGTGLGQTAMPVDSDSDGRLVAITADPSTIEIQRFADLSVMLNDVPIDSSRILWAGLTPGFAGLYQINLQLPDTVEPDPEIRVAIGEQSSPAGVKLATH
jgi:uncharacterized protein (TIGR03437 family)